LKYKVIEKDISLKDVEICSEAFVTATGWGICPVKSINKKKFKENNITLELQESFNKVVKTNIVKQYLSFL